MKIKIIVPFWDANENSKSFSSMYTTEWVEKLYRGVKRNTTYDFDFVVLTDRIREYDEPVEQVLFNDLENIGYHSCIECFRFGGPAIIMGLDTVITGDIDRLVEYCYKTDNKMALPIDPNFTNPPIACNGVTLLPPGNEEIYLTHNGENDMEWLRTFDHVFIDDVLPHRVKSYKKHVGKRGLGKLSVVYFHGEGKPHQLDEEWIDEHWK